MVIDQKDPAFIVKEQSPFNGEAPLSLLRQAWITPTSLFYARNHGDIPVVDRQAYRLAVTGLVQKPLSLSLAELQDLFEQRTITATLQCAGNRREELAKVSPVPGELPWGAGAVGTATWTGVLLRDVLQEAGLQSGAAHVDLTGLDKVQRQGRTFGFGGSIPLEKASNPEVLLVYEMNGEPLPPVHGFPLRLVVPGHIGARSVKWLSQIHIQSTPSTNYFYAQAYQLFPPQARAETVASFSGIKLGDMPVNSVICRPGEGETIQGNPVRVQGYAISGGGRKVERVDLSTDGGESWVQARLSAEESAWAWRFWEAQVELQAGPGEISVRAWDSAANTQPEEVRMVWNFKGYMNNAWHRVRVFCESTR